MTRVPFLALVCAFGAALVATQATAQQTKGAKSAKAARSLKDATAPQAGQNANDVQGSDDATQVASLDSVSWAAAGARLDQLKGKTVVVVTYVTWCPICNEWAPKRLSELNKVIQDKPVIVLAISTDTPPAKAKEYIDRAGLAGPNVLNGYDPNIAKNFGFKNAFFNYVVFSPDGAMASSGNFGTSAASVYVQNAKDLGRLRFVDASMSPELKEVLWPMELGYISEVQRSLKKSEKMLKPEDRTALKTAMDEFLDEEIKTAGELKEGDAAQRIDALEKVTFLSANFKSSPQGKEAKKLLAELTKDKSMKKEISAKKMYDSSMQAPDPDRRVVLLEKTAKQFDGTHYGELAEKAARETGGEKP